MSAPGSSRSGRFRRIQRIATVSVLIVLGLMWIGSAQAVHDTGMFELDGNVVHNAATTPPYDWTSLFGSTGNRLITPDPINGPLLADTFVDDTDAIDTSYFAGGTKIADQVRNMGCGGPAANNKTSMDYVYVALVQVPPGAPDNAGHQVLYLGIEKQAAGNGGDNAFGFWLFQDKTVGCDASGTAKFTGAHTDGDLFIDGLFTNGGGASDVEVFRWNGNDTTGSLGSTPIFTGNVCGVDSPDNVCGIANGATITSGPWRSVSTMAANTFVEAGIDMTDLLGQNGGCFTTFLADSQSSQSTRSQPKDYAGGQMNTCVPPPIDTTATPGGSSNPLGVSTQHDVATISAVGGHPDPTGTISFFLCKPSEVTAGGCVSGGTQVGSAKTISAGAATSDNASASLTNTVGKYCWRAEYTPDTDGSKFYVGSSDTNSTTECFTVIKNSPTVVTNASTKSGNVVGTGSACDSATLSGSFDGTGTITFRLTAPDNSSAQVGSPVPVNGDGTYQSPSCPALTEVGTYTWSASYSGDGLNNGAIDNGENESVDSISASPMVVTNASTKAGNVVGTGSACDSATLSGSFDGTGTITFRLTAPDNSSAQVGSPVPVNGDGTYQSPSCPALTEVGTYTWSASYLGDGLNNGAIDNGENESVDSIPTKPSIATEQEPASGSAGDTFKDKATLTGTFQPDGSASITWTLYPNDNCSGTPLGTDKVTNIDDNGTFETPTGVTVDAAGTYYWVAEFSGDTNNGSATSGCADEPVTVKGASIHIKKTTDAPQVSAGDEIGFTMVVWNDGSGDAKGVTLHDTLPSNPGLNWVVAGQGAGWSSPCSITAGVLTCGPDTVPAGTTKEESTFTVHITSVTDKSTAGDCGEGGGLVDNTGDVTTTNDGSDSSEATVCVAAPVIHIAKTADAAQVSVDDDIGFTMTVWNDGNGDAHGVMLNDVLPTNPGLSWSVDATGAGFGESCSIAAGVLSCGPVTVPAGTTQADSTFTVHITSGTTGATGGDCPDTGVVDNTGTVTTSNDGTDESSASTCVQAMVDLSITKSGSPADQELGAGNITWTMVVTNNGPSADTGVKVTDPMPTGNTYVSSTTTQGTCTGGPILNCTIGDMAAGESVTITLITTPSTVGQQTNTVNVVGNRPETNTNNNTATATVQTHQITPPPVKPCVAVSKVTPKQLFVGRKTTLTIHVTQGGKAVKGIHVRIKGAKINVKTNASNVKGVVKQTLKMKKAGILVFTPIASKACNTKRVGVTNVFTPPVTG